MESLHQPIQRRNFQRLDKLAGETFLPTAPLMGGPAEPAQRIDSRLLESVAGTQLPADRVTIQSRHLDIEKDDVGVTLAGDSQGVASVAANQDSVTSQLQQVAQ
jgi:hypothetical protein